MAGLEAACRWLGGGRPGRLAVPDRAAASWQPGWAGRAKSAQTEAETLPLTDANTPICSRRNQEERSPQEV